MLVSMWLLSVYYGMWFTHRLFGRYSDLLSTDMGVRIIHRSTDFYSVTKISGSGAYDIDGILYSKFYVIWSLTIFGAHVASAIWPHICLFTLSCCLVIDIVYNTFCYDWRWLTCKILLFFKQFCILHVPFYCLLDCIFIPPHTPKLLKCLFDTRENIGTVLFLYINW